MGVVISVSYGSQQDARPKTMAKGHGRYRVTLGSKRGRYSGQVQGSSDSVRGQVGRKGTTLPRLAAWSPARWTLARYGVAERRSARWMQLVWVRGSSEPG